MADRYDVERDRDRERQHNGGRDPNRNREWDYERYGERARNDWDRERQSGNEGRSGEGRYEDYRQRRGNEWTGRESQGYSDAERGDFSTRGDWGRQGSWGNYGNRPDLNRENEYRDRGSQEYGRNEYSRGDYGRNQSDFGGQNTGRTNLFGTGGGGFGTGMSSYGAGMGPYSGGAGSFGGGMGSYDEGQRGRHSGRGPKGWQRSDERIREDINERLTDHPHVDASEIEVTVQGGEVTLKGTVEERQAKRIAEDIAEGVSGVRDVHNQIRVQQGQQHASNQGQSETQRGTAGTTSRTK